MNQSQETRNPLGALIDRRRALAAQLAGVNLQIAMQVGDRDAARVYLHEMNAQIEARVAARHVQQAEAA